MTWHQTVIVGNLGRDPELQYTQSGRAWTRFTVAVSETWTDRQSNERREKTTWYNVSVFGPQAETVNRYLSKGRQVMVIGTVSARAYTNQAGEPGASLDLTARDVRFLSGGGGSQGGDSQGGDNSGGNYGNQGGGGNYDDDFSPPPRDMNDIPF